MSSQAGKRSFKDMIKAFFTGRRPASRRGPARVPLLVESLEERTVPTLMGNQLFPSDNPWNQQITNAPVAANSATLVASIGASLSLHPDFGTTYAGALNGIPYNVVAGTQAKVNVVIDAYASESDLQPIPIPANAVIEGDPLPSSQNTSDRHLIVYDQDNNIVYETFNTHRPSEEADGQWHADSEAVWDLNKNTFRTAGYTSADAAGLPILPGLVRPDEVLTQGKITHALRFTVPHTDAAWVYPASHEAGTNNASLPRMGERFRLKASFDISGFSAADQVILQALKDYGMIVADNGSAWYLSGAPSSLWNDSDLHNLTKVLGSNFEAVDLTPVVNGVSPSSGQAGTSVTVSGLDFSGGAGMTQVYFGNTPATSTQIVSDTQIIATVPSGLSGTVDVTVHSPYGVSATSAADKFTFTPGGTTGASQLRITGVPSSATAGSAFSLTVSALDANNNVVAGYLGTVHFTSNDGAATLPADYTFTAADNGVHTFSGVTLRTAGNRTVTATDTAAGSLTGSATVAVSPAAVNHLGVSAPSSATAGTAFPATVTALDPFGNTVTGYAGTITFSSSDSKAGLPSNYTFTASDTGVHAFSVTLKTSGSQTVTATDTVTGSITGTTTVTVNPAAASTLLLSGLPTSTTAGTSQTVKVTAQDAYGNTATGYRGTVKFTSNDSQAALPANYTFTATDAGIHSFTVTLKTSGSKSVTATDTVTSTITGSATTKVNPAAAATLAVSEFPYSVTAGAAKSLGVIAHDAYGNVATGYRGTVHFTSGDPQAVLPANYTFTSTDAGFHKFSGVILKTAGTQSITATDTVTNTITGQRGGIVVSPAAAAVLVVSGYPTSVTAGTAQTFTVTLKDAYGNVATGYTGTVHFSSSDAAALLSANYTFTAADKGVHTFTATFNTRGTQSLTVTDTVNGLLTGTEGGIGVL
jgi:hypothetical protein